MNQATTASFGMVTKSGTINSYFNGFAIAQKLKTYSTRKDAILQGLNTIGQNIFFDCNIDSTGPTAMYTLSFFANFDIILAIENGVMRMIA